MKVLHLAVSKGISSLIAILSLECVAVCLLNRLCVPRCSPDAVKIYISLIIDDVMLRFMPT